ncbi:MAG: metal ABC transporter permease [Patescibacteria group bacterium]
MTGIFAYEFMQRALAAGLIVGVVAPTIGLFLTVRRYSMISDTLSHVALAGVALGLLVGVHPAVGALFATLGAALVIERIRQSGSYSGDSLLALILNGSLALAVVVMGITKSFNAGVLGYLFGNIVTVSPADLALIAISGAVALAAVILLYKELFYVSSDEEVAAAQGLNVGLLNFVLVATAALVISASMRVVGVLLIGALMVIPVLAAMNVARSFLGALAVAVVFSVLSVLIGLVGSFELNLASGGTIVLVSMVFFASSFAFKRTG